MRKKLLFLLVLAVSVWLIASPAMAVSSTTNFTWNGDVTPDDTWIFFAMGDWGTDKFDDNHEIGFSYGFEDFLEVGGRWRLTENSDFSQDPRFDAKYRFDIGGNEACCCGPGCSNSEEPCCCGEVCNCGDSTGVAIGLDNINFDEDKNGKVMPYLAYTHDFGGLRGTLGYSFEEDNGAVFGGLDSAAGDVTLKWDWRQMNDGENWQTAFGLTMPFHFYDDNWNFKTFLTFSTDSTAPDIWHCEFFYLMK